MNDLDPKVREAFHRLYIHTGQPSHSEARYAELEAGIIAALTAPWVQKCEALEAQLREARDTLRAYIGNVEEMKLGVGLPEMFTVMHEGKVYAVQPDKAEDFYRAISNKWKADNHTLVQMYEADRQDAAKLPAAEAEVATLTGKLREAERRIPHPGDGSCDRCGKVPSIVLPTSLCAECCDGVTRAQQAEAREAALVQAIKDEVRQLTEAGPKAYSAIDTIERFRAHLNAQHRAALDALRAEYDLNLVCAYDAGVRDTHGEYRPLVEAVREGVEQTEDGRTDAQDRDEACRSGSHDDIWDEAYYAGRRAVYRLLAPLPEVSE